MDCTVIGDIFFDIIVQKNALFSNMVKGGVSYADSIQILHGGMGNVAAGIAHLGGTSNFIGKSGNDELGLLYRNCLTESNVHTNIFLDSDNPTGLCISLVDDKSERSLLVHRGANDYLNISEIENCTNEIIKSKYMFVSGFSLVDSSLRKSILTAIDIAKSGNVKIIFDPGAYNIITKYKEHVKKVLSMSDIFVPNFDEARCITDSNIIDDILLKLGDMVSIVALKLGRQGCIIKKNHKIIKSKGLKVNCIDTTGAGDAFVAALIFGLSSNYPINKIVELANWYASYNVQKLGARNFPNKTQIYSYVESCLKI